MDDCPLGLGLVVEHKPTEFSCWYRGGENLSIEFQTEV